MDVRLKRDQNIYGKVEKLKQNDHRVPANP